VIRPAILARLRGVQKTGSGWSAFCPAHDDQHKRSLSVGIGADGQTLLKCFASCPPERIVAAVHLTMADLAPPGPNGRGGTGRRIVATYDYRDETGALLYQVVRFEPKDFRPRWPTGAGGWSWGLGDVRRVCYRLPDLVEHERVFWCEGEKDVETLWALGLPATTSPSGAKSFRAEYADQVKAAAVREVVVLPDQDAAGQEYAATVATACQTAGLTVRVLALPGLPDKGDVTDWLAAGHTAAELVALAEAAPLYSTPTSTEKEAAPTVERIGDECIVRWAAHGTELGFTSLRESSDGLHAEVSIRRHGEEVHWSRLGLASSRSRDGIAKLLERAHPGDPAPWGLMVDRAARLVSDLVRRGEPAQPLRPRLITGPRFLVEPLLPVHQPTILYADGGEGKSTVALLVAVAVATGAPLPGGLRVGQPTPVLFCDYESTEPVIAEVVYLLERGLGVSCAGRLLYRRMVRPLVAEAPALRAEVARAGVGFVIVDSVAPAAGGEPETAEAALGTMTALRSLGAVTSLALAHVSKAGADQRTARPYGSVFYANEARMAWELRRAEDEGEDLVVALYNRKANGSRLHPPLGFRLAFTPEAIRVTSADLGKSPDLLARASLAQGIRSTLAAGALTIPQIAEAIDATEASVGRVIRRLREKGTIVAIGETRPYLWGLAIR
jgi:hypothetical protein